MRPAEPADERPLAWKAILADTPVYSVDQVELGPVQDVLGAEDIFHGLVVRAGPEGNDVMVPAEQVDTITNLRITLAITAEEVRALPPYAADESFRLGLVGLFRKHLGWIEGEEEPGQELK